MNRSVRFRRLCTAVQVPDALVRRLRRAVTALLETEHAPPSEITVILADDDYLRGLNREYRGKDVPTDVLSFGFYTDSPEGTACGDIFISLERVAAQAREYREPFASELARLVLHGTLHLCGYDHNTVRQEAVMNSRAEPFQARFTRGTPAL